MREEFDLLLVVVGGTISDIALDGGKTDSRKKRDFFPNCDGPATYLVLHGWSRAKTLPWAGSVQLAHRRASRETGKESCVRAAVEQETLVRSRTLARDVST